MITSHQISKYHTIWDTFPETNSQFAPENGWLEDEQILLGFSLLSGATVDGRNPAPAWDV